MSRQRVKEPVASSSDLTSFPARPFATIVNIILDISFKSLILVITAHDGDEGDVAYYTVSQGKKSKGGTGYDGEITEDASRVLESVIGET